ncbi:MAG TPA: hypothetical protein VE871_12385 [Longimicrobium sp.]|nr:hypothetical protein [Longimicrobium sp.]
MMRRIRRFAALLLVPAAACEPDPLVPIARDVEVTASLASPETYVIAFEVRNEGRRTVYAAACDDRIIAAVQPRDVWDDDDSSVFSVVCFGTAMPVPVAIAPGATARGQAQAPSPGEYRIGVLIRDAETSRNQWAAFSRGVVVPQ